MSILTGAQASYFQQGLAADMPTAPSNVAADAVAIYFQTDTHLWFMWTSVDWIPMEGAPDIQLTGSPDYKLQYSLDGGTTWTDITGWDTNFPLAVAHYAPKIQMNPSYSYPPIPQYLTTGPSAGADYVYEPAYD